MNFLVNSPKKTMWHIQLLSVFFCLFLTSSEVKEFSQALCVFPYYPHIAKDSRDLERLNILLNVTQLASGTPGIQTYIFLESVVGALTPML